MRKAKPLSEVWIHFERQKVDNKYMAKCKYCQTEKQEKNRFFLSWVFFSRKKTFTSLVHTKVLLHHIADTTVVLVDLVTDYLCMENILPNPSAPYASVDGTSPLGSFILVLGTLVCPRKTRK